MIKELITALDESTDLIDYLIPAKASDLLESVNSLISDESITIVDALILLEEYAEFCEVNNKYALVKKSILEWMSYLMAFQLL